MEQKEGVKNWGVKFIFLISLVIGWTIVLIMHFTSETSLKVPILISIFLSIAFFISLFFKNISEKMGKLKEKDQIPELLGLDKVKELVKNEIENVNGMWNHPLAGVGLSESTANWVNKNLIYDFHVKLLLPEKFGQNNEEEYTCHILINASYPRIKPQILSGKTDKETLKDRINLMSQNPKDDPDLRETISENVMTGAKITTKEKIQPKTEIKSEDKKV